MTFRLLIRFPQENEPRVQGYWHWESGKGKSFQPFLRYEMDLMFESPHEEGVPLSKALQYVNYLNSISPIKKRFWI